MRDGSDAARWSGWSPSWRCSAALAGTVGLGRRRLGRRRRLRAGHRAACWPGACARSGARGLGPADRVTLARATLVGGVAALAADSFARPVPVPRCWSGWPRWRWCSTRSTAGSPAHRHRLRAGRALRHGGRRVPDPGAQRVRRPLGRRRGCWRSARRATSSSRPAGCCRGCARPLPPRHWRKVVAAIQGIVLDVVAADVLPRA